MYNYMCNYTDWKADSTKYCTEFWEGWNSRFQNNKDVQVKDIGTFTNTINLANYTWVL